MFDDLETTPERLNFSCTIGQPDLRELTGNLTSVTQLV